MRIIVHRQTLTDGSAVYDVDLLQDQDQLILHARDEATARKVASGIRDAINECLDEPIEWICDYR